ncbi:MAG: hypothetical protein ACLSIL_03855 [Enterococcus casseliflavus]
MVVPELLLALVKTYGNKQRLPAASTVGTHLNYLLAFDFDYIAQRASVIGSN